MPIEQVFVSSDDNHSRQPSVKKHTNRCLVPSFRVLRYIFGLAMTYQKDFHVAIVGGGMCGLASAVYLSRAGIKVDVFESAVR